MKHWTYFFFHTEMKVYDDFEDREKYISLGILLASNLH